MIPAGWTLTDDAEPEAACPGSGQIAAPWSPLLVRCPCCAANVARDAYTFAIGNHYADPLGALPLDLWRTDQ